MRRALFLLLTFVVFAGCGGFDKKVQYQKTVDNFTFYYTAQEQTKTIDLVSLHKSKFDSLASKYLPVSKEQTKVDIFLKDSELAKSDIHLAKGINGYYNGSIVMRTGSLTVKSPNGNQMTLASPNPVYTIYHEYTHHLTDNFNLPRWLSDGISTLLPSQLTEELKKKKNPLTVDINLAILSDESNWDKYPDDILYNYSAVYVKHLIDYIGPQSFKQTLLNTASGDSFETSLEKVTKKRYSDIVRILESK